MFIFYNLPTDLLRNVYEYDNTYKYIYSGGPMSEILQINFYKDLIRRNKVYITLLKWWNHHIVFSRIIYKEVINEIHLAAKFKNKIKNTDFYETLYGFFGRMYINCRRETFT